MGGLSRLNQSPFFSFLLIGLRLVLADGTGLFRVVVWCVVVVKERGGMSNQWSLLYPCEQGSLGSFLRRVAIDFVRFGYWYYVAGTIPGVP